MFNQPYFVIMYDVHMLFSSTHQSNNNAISRPDFLIIKYHDPSSTDSFSRLRKINLKSSQMPTDIAQTLQNPSLKKMCWDAEATQGITHSLLSEAGSRCKRITTFLWIHMPFPYSDCKAV